MDIAAFIQGLARRASSSSLLRSILIAAAATIRLAFVFYPAMGWISKLRTKRQSALVKTYHGPTVGHARFLGLFDRVHFANSRCDDRGGARRFHLAS